MSARLMNAMKKWWMIALVFALALSLTSCARSGNNLQNAGFGQCDGTLGQVDVHVKQSTQGTGLYNLILVPYTMTVPAEQVSVTITVQNSPSDNITTISGSVLNPGQQLIAGVLTLQQLQHFNVLAIYSYQPGVVFTSANPARSAVCVLPYLGDNLTYNN